jgi:hypothetical protein
MVKMGALPSAETKTSVKTHRAIPQEKVNRYFILKYSIFGISFEVTP